jgi:hypothetical protein
MTTVGNTDPVSACPISVSLAVSSSISENGAERNQFQHLLQLSYPHLYEGLYSPVFVSIGKLLHDLSLFIRGRL